MFEPGERIVELVLVNDHSQVELVCSTCTYIIIRSSHFMQYLHFGNKLASVILRDIEIVDYMNQVR